MFCAVCYDSNATIPLFSCDNCYVCNQCQLELITAVDKTRLYCNCDKKVSIIPIRVVINDIINDTTINDTTINDTTINDTTINDTTINNTIINNTTQDHQLQAVTKALTKLTKLFRSLTTLSNTVKELNRQAPTKITATLKARLDYLPANLVEERTNYLVQQLLLANQPVLKTYQLELDNLSDLMRICDNILVSKNSSQQFQSHLLPRINQAVETARVVRDGNYYNVLIYREVGPVNLASIGVILPVFSSVTKTGFIDADTLTQTSIKVSVNGLKEGRQQQYYSKSLFEDYYRQGHLMWSLNFHWLGSAKAEYHLIEYTKIVERSRNRDQRDCRSYRGLVNGHCLNKYSIVGVIAPGSADLEDPGYRWVEGD